MCEISINPAHMRRRTDVGLVLVYRLRRRPNIKSTLDGHIAFLSVSTSGTGVSYIYCLH